MAQFIANLTGTGGLLRVRSGIAMALVGGFVWGFVDGLIAADVYVPVVVGVVGTYFGARIAAGALLTNGSSPNNIAAGEDEPPA